MPTFLLSDSRKVGYAYPWVRPPAELYNLIPISNSDGLDISYRMHSGEVNNTVQLIYGEGRARSPANGTVTTGKDGRGIFNTLEYGQTNKPADVMAVGANIEGDDWFLMGEYGRILTHSAYGDREGGYISAGYRIRKFMPYLTYAFADVRSNTSDPGLTMAGNPVVDARYTALNTELNNLLASLPQQKTFSFGVRWDAYKDLAVKFQFEHARLDDTHTTCQRCLKAAVLMACCREMLLSG